MPCIIGLNFKMEHNTCVNKMYTCAQAQTTDFRMVVFTGSMIPVYKNNILTESAVHIDQTHVYPNLGPEGGKSITVPLALI